MRLPLILSLTFLGLAGCVPQPTTTTYVTPATTTTTYTPASSTTVVNASPGYQPVSQPSYVTPPTTTTVYQSP
jgi:hypothetical protein